jgi:Terpene cyclase DEP1
MPIGDRPVKEKNVYLILAILGAVLPYSQFIPWVMENGLHLGLLVRQLFANRIGGFFGLDVLVSAVVLVRFVRVEGQRLRMQHLWLPIVGLCTIGVSFGLPLFLCLREGGLGESNHASGSASAGAA